MKKTELRQLKVAVRLANALTIFLIFCMALPASLLAQEPPPATDPPTSAPVDATAPAVDIANADVVDASQAVFTQNDWLAQEGFATAVEKPAFTDPWPIPLLDDAERAALEGERYSDPAFAASEWYLQPDEGDPNAAAIMEEAVTAADTAELASPDIVGGLNATAGEFPWQGALLVGGAFNCGASLIHPRWMLTAAHCVTDAYDDGSWDAYLPGEIDIVLGEHNRNVSEGSEVYRKVVQVSVFPGYNANNITNDVALLKLATPVPLSARVQTIGLATTAEQNAWAAPGHWAVVSGWGRTSTGGPLANSLMKVANPVITPAVCSSLFSGVNTITADMICVGTGGAGSCNGDSGGPLIVGTPAGARQVGIVSWGLRTCENGPSVYARAAYFRNWITGVISPAFAPAVANPGFELGANGAWGQYSLPNGYGSITASAPVAPHGGSYVAWLGGDNNMEKLILQNVNLVDRNATLRFWYLVRSQDACGQDYGQFLVNYNPVLTIQLCASNAAAGWREAVINLGATGATASIGFYSYNGSSSPSQLFIDDVTVTTVPAAPAAITSFSPTTARDGDVITLTGTGFFDVTNVAFGTVAAAYSVTSDTQMKVTVPAAARSGKIVITSNTGSSQSTQDFTKIHTLTVRIGGLGTGTITRQGSGIICNGCKVDMADGASVTLTAAPTGSAILRSWSTPCAGKPATCTFTATSSSVLGVLFDTPDAKHTWMSSVRK